MEKVMNKLYHTSSFKPLLLLMITLFYLGCSPKTSDKITNNDMNKTLPTKPPVTMKTDSFPLPIVKKKYEWDAPIPTDPSVKMGTLANGMRYYIQRNTKPENRMELRLAVNTGSMQEADNQKGLAHFVEHMAFNGTKHFEKNELVNYLESIGMKFGPDLNAFTSFDETVYMLQVPTDDEQIMDKGLLIMEDWATNISFENDEIDKERGVVLSEWRTGLGAQERMRNQWFPVVFNGSQYAERMPIGDPKVIETAGYETIKSYYKKWYRPDLMAISVVGDFDVTEMETRIKTQFGKIPAAVNAEERKLYDVPNHVEPSVAIVTDKEASSTAIQFLYKHDRKPLTTISDYRNSLIADMYNGMLNHRLDELTRAANPPYVYAYAGYGSFVRTKDAYYSYVLVPDDGVETGVRTIVRENMRVKNYGFTDIEFEAQKTEILKKIDNAYRERDKTLSSRYAMRYVYHFLQGETMTGAEYDKFLVEQLLSDIAIEDVNDMAYRWITPQNQAIIVTMPDKAEVKVPTKEDILAWIKEEEGTKMPRYVAEEQVEGLMSQPPKANKLYGKKDIKSIGAKELNFPKGIKVILKPTDFQNNQVLVTAFRKGGSSLYAEEEYMAANAADRMMKESGLSGYSANQMDKFLARKNLSLRPYINELYEGFEGSSASDDLEELLQMIYLYFTAPGQDAEAGKAYLKKQMTQLENQEVNPAFQFYDAFNKALYDGNFRRKLKTAEDFATIDLNRSQAIFKERFHVANDFTFVFVGNFDNEKLMLLLERYIGSLPTDKDEGITASWKDLEIKKATGKVEKTIQKGQEQQSRVGLAFHGDFEYTTQNAYDFNSMVSVLNILLRENLREEQGGVYGVSVQPTIEREPKTSFSVVISFVCAPKDVEMLTKSVFDEIKNLQTKGCSEQNLAKVQETQRREYERAVQENNFWKDQLAAVYKYNGNPNDINTFAATYIDFLNVASIKKAAQLYFNMDNYIKVVLMPENQ